MTRMKIVSAAVALACLGGAQTARATDVFRLEGFGAVSRAMGGVATAIDTGAAGMMTNPATLSLMKEGSEAMVGLDLVTTDIEVRNKATGESASSGNHSRNRGPYAAPEAAFTRRVGEWAFGVGAFAQGGLGTEYGRSSFLSRASGGLDTGLDNSSRLLVLNIPFAASFKATEKLSIGGSIDAMWQGLNLNLLLGADQVGSLIGAGRATGSLIPVLGGLPDLRGAHFSLTKNQPLASGVDAWGYTGRIGFVYQATDDTTLGAAYTSKSHLADMTGRATLTAIDGAAGQIPLAGKIRIQDFQMPATLNLGVSQRVTEKLLLAADLSQVYWKSVMKDIKVAFGADAGGDLQIRLPQDYKDQTILALGGAYQVSEQLTLRAGLRYATQALRASTLFAVIPATPKKHLSAGLGYAFSPASRLDFAWSHAFSDGMDNTSLPNTSAPMHVSHSQDNATLNYTYRF
ncbi:MAG: aromatic hydrocarbon degradation protein [Zoogloea sp.]|nr:MAG: aromatic hydrocarbon degradation protein [Zoogloea sp.]